MRLLRHSETGYFSLTQFPDNAIPPYAILSHTWGADTEEVTFDDITNGKGKDKPGCEKIYFCGEQAARDKLDYFWIDTCCINKSSDAELSESINSMFRWYQCAKRCYVYLSDVSEVEQKRLDKEAKSTWEGAFQQSRWWTRGWTLQELLAPTSVQFFSKEGKYLGDRQSLAELIQKITGINILALQGSALSNFETSIKLKWAKNRQTTREEDLSYSLLGIFGISMPVIYGEGKQNAMRRLMREIDQYEPDEIYVRNLYITDPRDDKMRIEYVKGGLLEDSYRWVLQNSDFQRWQDDRQCQLLWIKGDPGKGKTMLLCGLVNELKSMDKTALISYFFCQHTDARLNNAMSVLQGLLYMIIRQQPSLVSHLRRIYQFTGQRHFNDVNAWFSLSEIFTDILQDPTLECRYVIIDAVNECVVDLPKLLYFVVQKLPQSSQVKWIVSSRNLWYIEEWLEGVDTKVILDLERNAESVSMAVSKFIQHRVLQLACKKKYNNKTRDDVLDYLSTHANDTFLWVALVCKNLESIPRWKTLQNLNAFPPDLIEFYEANIAWIGMSDNADLCRRILSTVAIVYRPVRLEELSSLVGTLGGMTDEVESLREIIGLCGSFLSIRGDTIYFVHQSAKDFLLMSGLTDPEGKGGETALIVN
ncbi:heterokaryon incompatibility protein-domain-containing protein [Clohesyomyces aquaticus]|uniref:Heterokaryon incompatibility protein-domain-containing protein n=1 Tax=Clohesyomyces aquaticus TaxID=1231657 RepID=A0A1Y1YTY9_9PLEO|nr:heterokaryon incompatibility protein-domain-containing protein [Clohesyomyces aquaticus]